ncbi:Right handed beta helix region [Candidatus Anstonella stagnisolia]|nr:Right handed beta helix region [Candidatus Anstonella stagnisolia]
MRPFGKGQGSVEFLAILGVALVVVVVMTVAANDRLVALGKERTLTDAENSVNDLARAANNVYHRGSGSSQNVYITIPSDTNLSKSYIANHTINLNLRGTDVSARTEAQVSGKFPFSTGGTWIKVQSKGSYISVGNYYLDINRTSLYFSMQNGTSATFPLTIYNRGNRSITVNITTDASKYSDAFLLSLQPSSGFTIPAFSSTEMDFSFFTYPSAGGIYPAFATFSATNATSGEAISEQLQLPLTIQVILPVQYQNLSGTSRLILSPSEWHVRLPPGNGSDQLFFVTTDGTYTAQEIDFVASTSGNFAISGLEPFYNVSSNDPPGPGIRTLSVNFSATGANGNYLGTLNATADGAYRATTILNFTIDSTGPSAANLSTDTQTPGNNTIVRISLNATELFGGYVSMCQYSINNGAYANMAPLDGTFNAYVEGAYVDTTLTADGLNNITARCKDDLGNWGNTTNISIYVDSSGPIVTITGVSASVQDITVNATASELSTGNLNVTWCNATFYSNDTGISNTTLMTPSSGSYNSSYTTLNATMTLDYGLYTIGVTCSDSFGNTRAASYEFYHNINSCGVLLNRDNIVYRLGNNVNTSSTYCFQATADNVTLDCMGKTMAGTNASGSYGFYTDQTGTTIKNCIISNFSSAIYYNTASGGSILNNSASTTFSGGYGIVLNAATGNAITNNIASSSNGSAVYLAASSNGNALSGNTASGTSGAAITLSGSSSNNITNSNATSALGYGILLSTSTGNQITGTSAYSASTNAVYITSSSDNNGIGISGATNDSAIYIDGGANNAIDCQGASISGTNTTGNYGVYSSQPYTLVNNCNISNFATAIYLQNAANSTISNTSASSTYGIGGYGIDLEGTNNTLITASTVSASGAGTTGILLNSASTKNNVSGSSISSANWVALSIMASSTYNSVSFCNITGKTSTIYNGTVHLYSSARNNFTNVNITSTSGTAFFANGSTSTYTLIANSTLSQASTGYVFYFVAGNFTLADSNINKSGTGSYGIYAASASSITNNVINGSSAASYAVYMAGTGNIFTGNTLFSKTSTAVYFSSGGNKIVGNNISINSTGDYGIYLSSTSTLNTVENNTVSSTTASALYITSSSSSNTVKTNSFTTISNNTVTVAGASNTNKFIQNNMTSTSGAGIYITNASGTNLTGNNLASSSGCGAWLNTPYSSYTVFSGNSISSASNSSLCLSSSNSNNFTNNTFYSSSSNGIAFSNSNSSTFANNSINASGSGILLDSASMDNSFYWNSLYRATAYINNSNPANFFSIANFTNTSGLIGYWSFDANISSTTTGALPDESGNGNAGTLGGGTASQVPAWASSGKIGGTYTFDGNDDFAKMPDADSLDVQTGNFTISAWVYPISEAWGYIVAKDGCGDPNIYSITTGGGSPPSLRLQNSAGTNFFSTSPSNISMNAWSHIVAYKSGTTMGLYVNGVLVNTTAISGTFSNNAFEFDVGRRSRTDSGCPRYFNGSIDDVRIFNRALSAAEISALYSLKAQGNYYDNIKSVSIYDSDGDSFGDSGSAYPYTSATSSRWVGSGTDYGPMYANTTAPYACMVLDIAGQTYNVVSDITASGAGACFNVTAQNVILNCNGHTITGDNSSNSYGVFSSKLNTTITNCNINNFGTGIWLENGASNGTISGTNISITKAYSLPNGVGIWVHLASHYNQIINSNVTSTLGHGILLDSGPTYNQIINSSGTSVSNVGLYFYSSTNNTILNSVGASGTSSGIKLTSSSNNNQVTNSNATSSSSVAGYISSGSTNNVFNGGTYVSNASASSEAFVVDLSSHNNQLLNLNITATGARGALSFSNANNLTVINSSIYSPGYYTFFGGGASLNDTFLNNNITGASSYISYVNNSIFANNTFSTSGNAFRLVASSNNIVQGNRMSSSGSASGIQLESGSSNNTVAGNNASSSSGYGIYITSSNSNNLTNNNATSTSNYGIYDSSGSSNSYTNNRASGTRAFHWYLTTGNFANNNTASGGGNIGCIIENSNTFTFANNTCTCTSGNALVLQNYNSAANYTGNNVTGNNFTCTSSGTTVQLGYAPAYMISNSFFTNNVVSASTGTGLYVRIGYGGNSIVNNTITSASGLGISLSSGANNYFENNSNCISCSNSTARFYSNAAQNISSNTNIGWWPLLSSNGSDATALASTAYYNGSTGGRFSNWTANSYLTYWYNGQVNLYGCQNLTVPGTYLLKQNVSINGSTCFIFSTADVTLDCQNYWVTGDNTLGTFGVYTAQNGPTVQNCNIQYFDDGIYYNYTDRGLIQNTFANVTSSYTYLTPYTQGAGFAIYGASSRANTILNSTGISQNGNGITLRALNVSVINSTGISTNGNNTLSGGIWLIGSGSHRITGSTGICTGGACSGITMRGTVSNTITNSTATASSTYYGIFISQSSDMVIDNVTMNSTGTGGGIQLGDRCYRNTIKNSLINITSSVYGIYESASGTDTTPARNNSYINVSIIGANKGIFLYDEHDAGAYFENVSNCLSCDNSALRFRSNATLNISSKENTGWWPLLSADGSNATVLANTAFYNGSSGGKNSDWSANPMLSYWYNGQADISACMALSAPGIYTLSSDLSINGSTCISISAQNVTLDCAGHTITGDNTTSTYGVYSNQKNTTVKNCNIDNFQHGIYFNGATYGAIQNNTAITRHSTGYSIYLVSSSNNILSNNNGTTRSPIWSTGATELLSSNNNQILNSAAGSLNSGGGYGLSLDSSSNNQIINSTGYGGGNTAIGISSGSNNSIINSSGIASGYYGIKLDTTTNNLILNSNTSSSYYVFWITASSNNQIINTAATSTNPTYSAFYLSSSSNNNTFNLTRGISTNNSALYITSGANNTIDCQGANIIGTNSSYGVYSTQYGTTVKNCNISNFQDGIRFNGATYGTIQNTNASTTNTTGYGIYLLGSADSNTLQNDNAIAKGTAIYINGSSSNIVTGTYANNTASGTNPAGFAHAGIYIFNTNNNQVINSTMGGVGYGIIIHQGAGKVINSTGTASSAGIFITYTGSAQVINSNGTSTSSGPGIQISGTSETSSNIINASIGISASGHGISLASGGSNNYIDCQGKSITGTNTSSTYGIYSTLARTTVKNCIISNFSDGIRFNGASNGSIQNTIASTTRAGGSGIYLTGGATNNTITNSIGISASGQGINVDAGSNGNTFTSTSGASTSGTGLQFSSSNNTLTGLNDLNNSVGLVSYWKFDEGTSTTASDSRGGNIGTMYNGPAWTTGKSGQALSFDGFEDMVTVPYNANLIYTGGDMSWSVWVNPTAGETDGGYIISKPWNGLGQYNYQFYSYGSRTIQVTLLGATSFSSSTTSALPAGQWSHIVFSVEGSSKTVKIYVNGNLSVQNTHSITNWTPSSGNTNINLAIGTLYPYGVWAGNSVFSFNGTIDEPMFFNRVLSAQEVALLYQNPSSRIPTGSSTSGYGIYLNSSSSNYFENASNCPSCAVTPQRFYSNAAQNASSRMNIGWWPLLESAGSDATTLNMTAFFNGSAGGTNYDGTTNAQNTYWMGGNYSSLQACGALSSPNTVYRLGSDVSIAGATCFNVTAQNVTLNCVGHSVSGDNTTATYGIYSNKFNTTVKNCNISNFDTGIYFNTASNGTMQNNNVSTTNTASAGTSPTYAAAIVLYNGASFNTLANNNATATAGKGIFVSTSSNGNAISGSSGTSASNGGFYFYTNSNNNQVINSIGTSASGSGFNLNSGVSNNQIINSTGISNSGKGIWLAADSLNNSLTNSNFTSNSSNGILLDTRSNSTQIISSTAYSNATSAIYITAGTGSNVLNLTRSFTTNLSAVYIDGAGGNSANNIIDCQGASMTGNNISATYGIYSTQSNTTIQNCNVSNFQYGVYLSSATGSDVLNSTISTSNNAGFGIYVTGSSGYVIAGNNVSATGNNASSTATTSIYLTAATGSLIENNTVNASDTTLPALFNNPIDIAESGNNLYVADASNYLVRQIDLTTNFSSLVAGALENPAYIEGVGASAHFYNTYSVAAGTDGYLYVADYSNNRIRKINLATNETSLVAGSTSGYANGVGAAAKFSAPRGLSYDPAGFLYVADEGNHRIRKIDLATNTVTLLSGSGTAGYLDGANTTARFYAPASTSLGTDGYLYVADSSNHRIRKVELSTGTASLVAGSGTAGYLEGIGAAARFYYPGGVAFGADGYLYVADTYDHCIRKIELSTNTTSLVAGSTSRVSGTTDGVGSAARFYYPRGITYDSAGTLYVADTSNHRIRQVNLGTTSVSRITGSGTAGYMEGAGTTTYSGHGIYLTSSATSNIVRNNTAFSSSANGIDVEASSTNLTGNSGSSITGYGIYAGIPQYGLVANNTGVSYAGSGIGFSSSTNNANAQIYNNGGSSTTEYGILVTARDSNVSNNTGISFNDVGFMCSSCLRNDLTANSGTSNISYGNYYASSTYNRVSNESGTSLYGYGCRFLSSSYNNISTGGYSSNASYAMYFDSDTYNNLSSSTFASNSYYGLGILTSNNNSFVNNFATSLASQALRLDTAHANTFINNSGISNTSVGLAIYYSENNTFIDNTARSNTSYGIYFYSSTTAFSRYNSLIENNATSGTSYALAIDARSNNNTLINNTAFSGSGAGIYVNSAYNNTLNGNTATSNASSYGIYISSSDNNTVINNNATSRSVQAILLNNANNNNITNNVATILVSNGAYILHLLHSDNNTVSNNVFSSTLTNTGIRLENSSDNDLENNIAGAGASYGIYLYNGTGGGRTDRNTLTNNTATSTSNYGIYLNGANANILTGNNATSGTSSAVYIALGANNSLIRNTMYAPSSYGVYILNSLNNYFEYNNNSLEYTGSSVQKFYAGAAQNTSSKGNRGWWPILAGTGTESVIQAATAYFNGTAGGLDANGAPNPANTYWYNGQS